VEKPLGFPTIPLFERGVKTFILTDKK